ncbi:unnamed protein product [Darwinula stevensoni]|uniref:N-acetylglucosaminylphosphatidylinositol deacetylase n=1 Tax=Darwinula stevensoni TaxID=69355 RepID=A0A7R8X6U9_9CRUS|nr:unnamed protein product [Darwinula stevensoni]CAG0886282.1 unnamed protein product [Darwinula stevensoni]
MNIFGIHLEWEGLKSILEFSASAVGILLLTCVVLFYFLVSFKPRCRTVGRTRVAILYKGRGESGLAKRTWMGAVPWFAPDERDNRAFLSVCEARHENSVFQQKRVLLLTAHPDDECMFFGPCILDLLENDTQVFVLCFSPGSGGLQKVRKYELLDSCETLGIPRENVFLLNFTHLPDNPSLDWKPSLIAGLVLYHIEMLSCDAVVTFDNTGISGHVNHRALYLGVKMLLCTRSVPACEAVLLLLYSIHHLS